jgi:transcriptional regulator with XRE-family HTH domain
MQRVHRSLSRDEVEALREKLAALVPEAKAAIPELLRMMRLITRKSQAEYALLCGVAPRVLADVEAGRRSPRVETLEKLFRPFGYRVGVVTGPEVSPEARRLTQRYGTRTKRKPARQSPEPRSVK